MTDKKKRTRLVCSTCGNTVRTLKSGTTECLPCAAKGHWPWAQMSKTDRESVRNIERVSEIKHWFGGAA